MTTIAAANRWLGETYWPADNAAFAVAPAETGSAFVADRTGRVRDILCIQEERRVGKDNTVKWRGLTLQIPPSPLGPHLVRAMVRVHAPGRSSLPRYSGRVGLHIDLFEACLAFTRVAACTLARSPTRDRYSKASAISLPP